MQNDGREYKTLEEAYEAGYKDGYDRGYDQGEADIYDDFN